MAKRPIIREPDFKTPEEWVVEWLELQPLSRFPSPEGSIDHPGALIYLPTVPGDWALFWTHARDIVFRIILGLKSCSPHSARRMTAAMKVEVWAAWLDDVLWVLYQLLHQYVSRTYDVDKSYILTLKSMGVHGKGLMSSKLGASCHKPGDRKPSTTQYLPADPPTCSGSEETLRRSDVVSGLSIRFSDESSQQSPVNPTCSRLDGPSRRSEPTHFHHDSGGSSRRSEVALPTRDGSLLRSDVDPSTSGHPSSR